MKYSVSGSNGGRNTIRMRVTFLAAMLMICSAGVLAQDSATPNNTGQATDAASSAVLGSKERPVLVSTGVIMRLLLHNSDPVYPEDAKGVTGSAILLALIDDKGKVESLSVIAGPEMLRDAALDAVKHWTFKPFLLNGKPMYVKTQFTLKFGNNP